MRILGRYEGLHAFGFAGDRFGVWDFGAKVRSAAGFRGTMQASSPTNYLQRSQHAARFLRGGMRVSRLTEHVIRSLHII